jgi:ubiquitin-activating enzyme E1
VGQEVIKACTGKFTPLNQFFFFDSIECLPEADLPEAEVKPAGTRYDGQIAVIGRTLQAQIQGARYFLIGAGAIGCEMLKNWAMMGTKKTKQ